MILTWCAMQRHFERKVEELLASGYLKKLRGKAEDTKKIRNFYLTYLVMTNCIDRYFGACGVQVVKD